MDALWFFLTAPARLIAVLWPVLFILPLFSGVLAVVLRGFVLHRIEAHRVHPLMRSRIGWPLVVAGAMFVTLWLGVSLAVLVLILAARAVY